jgi:hypothetical protein
LASTTPASVNIVVEVAAVIGAATPEMPNGEFGGFTVVRTGGAFTYQALNQSLYGDTLPPRFFRETSFYFWG